MRFRDGHLQNLKIGERVVADRGYKHSKCFTSETRIISSTDTAFYDQVISYP